MTTVKQLIEALQKIENQDMAVEIAVNFQDRTNAVYANVTINEYGRIATKSPWDTVRINADMKPASLHTHYAIREMKNK